uniref:Uncharacterized protein n=1 Tax=uncultured prokaryote TaxID=198431 RepID=A0A0H5Q4Y5_9ZZZZ|nr:hypothetical protein [uncultured prokaryote]
MDDYDREYRALEMGRAAERVEEATKWLENCVMNARCCGESWSQIGYAVGLSRQAAWKRWSDAGQATGAIPTEAPSHVSDLRFEGAPYLETF